MEIEILQLLDGGRRAKRLTLIIDVFRAFSVEAYFFANGAEKIFPIADIEIAYRLKQKNPEVILAGERGGKILPGFDVGNSPSELIKLPIHGKTVVHTTSAGTQGVANAIRADEILGAVLVNAKATAKYIKQRGIENVSLVCMGLETVVETEEDTLCTRYVKALLEGTESTLKMPEEIEKLKYTSGAKFFDAMQNTVFPEKDFYMCTQVDKFDFVMKLNGEVMEKIGVK